MNGRSSFAWPIAGSIAILALPITAELVTGSELAYMIAVMALIPIFWIPTKLSRREVGLVWGDAGSYLVAVVVPVAAMAAIAAVAWAAGAVAPDAESGPKLALMTALMTLNTMLGALITEDGFFRGCLWGNCRRAGLTPARTLVWTSVVFGLWHLPVALIEADFRLPAAVVPVYVVNAMLIGVIYGMFRLVSGSVLAACVCHGVWNGLAYNFFGYGTKTAALGIERFSIFDPERGWIGLVINAAAVAVLWRWYRRRGTG